MRCEGDPKILFVLSDNGTPGFSQTKNKLGFFLLQSPCVRQTETSYVSELPGMKEGINTVCVPRDKLLQMVQLQSFLHVKEVGVKVNSGLGLTVCQHCMLHKTIPLIHCFYSAGIHVA